MPVGSCLVLQLGVYITCRRLLVLGVAPSPKLSHPSRQAIVYDGLSHLFIALVSIGSIQKDHHVDKLVCCSHLFPLSHVATSIYD